MHRSTKSRWVITAENCLTGAREVISLPMERLDAISKCKELIRASAIDSHLAYKTVRIKEYNQRQLTLW